MTFPLDSRYWFRVNKEFLTKHPEVVKQATLRRWSAVYRATAESNIEIYNHETGEWREVKGSATLNKHEAINKPIRSVAELHQAIEAGYFIAPTAMTRDGSQLQLEFLLNAGGGIELYPVVPMAETVQLMLHPEYSSAKLEFLGVQLIRGNTGQIAETAYFGGFAGVLDIMDGGRNTDAASNVASVAEDQLKQPTRVHYVIIFKKTEIQPGGRIDDLDGDLTQAIVYQLITNWPKALTESGLLFTKIDELLEDVVPE